MALLPRPIYPYSLSADEPSPTANARDSRVNERIQDLAQVDRVIHEPARLMIMTILRSVEEADFLYLQREGGFTQGNLSSHLAKLEEAGYVQIQKVFKGKTPLTICKLTETGKDALRDYSYRMVGVLQPLNGTASKARKRAT